MVSSSSMEVNPGTLEAYILRDWYDTHGKGQDYRPQTISTRGSSGGFSRDEIRLLDDVRGSNLGSDNKSGYFSSRATIMHIKLDNIVYPACPTQGCHKKVIEQHDVWRCEKCDKVYKRPSYR
jgi:replication factor A1